MNNRDINGFYSDWENIYNKEYYLDYVIFCHVFDRHFGYYSPYNIYDIFEVFFYNKAKRIIIIANYCAFIESFNLGISVSELKKIAYRKLVGPYSIINRPNMKVVDHKTRVSLWEFIKLEEGHYF